MQQAGTQERVEYASVGWRFAAVLVDMAVLFGLLIFVAMVWVAVLVAQGKVDPEDPAAAQAMAQDITATSDWVANVVLFGVLFIYYVLLEGIFGASIGKLVLRMRVVALDGSRPSGLAIVVRNIIRIPEAWLLYIPAGVSCLVSGRRQRLGDRAARTVVVRRAAQPVAGVPAQAPPAAGPVRAPSPSGGPAAPVHGPPAAPARDPAASGGAWPAEPAPQAPAGAGTTAPPAAAALADLKTAALVARGAHLAYLHFSERELASEAGDPASGYSDEYVSAWFTLADAVASFKAAHAAVVLAATAAGQTLDQACAAQPDLAHQLRALAPYLAAQSDEQVHDAFLAVARSELRTT